MEIAVNTSVIISALLKEGLTRRIIFLAPFELCTVPYAREEIENHRGEFLARTKLDEDAFQFLLDLIFSKVQCIEPKEIQLYRDKAAAVMKDIDINDAPFVALALHLGCPIWSNDEHFKRQYVVKTYNTREIIRLLEEVNG